MPRARRWITGGVLFGLFGSIVTHGSIVIALILLFLHGGRAGIGDGNGGGAGESGNTGAGDTDIDVSLASPAAVATAAATETIPTPPTPVTPPPAAQQKIDPDEMAEPVASAASANRILPTHFPWRQHRQPAMIATTNGGKTGRPNPHRCPRNRRRQRRRFRKRRQHRRPARASSESCSMQGSHCRASGRP